MRAEVRDDDGRASLIEAELSPAGRNRVQVNRQRLARASDLLGVVRVTVFSPDDLTLVKGAPADRRRFLDDTLVALAIEVRRRPARARPHRAPAQHAAAARPAAGSTRTRRRRSTSGTPSSAEAGEQLRPRPGDAGRALHPIVAEAYEQPRRRGRPRSGWRYDPPWRRPGWPPRWPRRATTTCAAACRPSGRTATSSALTINGLPARTHASQGEQRTLALALRLAAHRLVAERTGSTPVLVLDDVLSELDPGRATALLDHLPAGPGRDHHGRGGPAGGDARPGVRASSPAPSSSR